MSPKIAWNFRPAWICMKPLSALNSLQRLSIRPIGLSVNNMSTSRAFGRSSVKVGIMESSSEPPVHRSTEIKCGGDVHTKRKAWFSVNPSDVRTNQISVWVLWESQHYLKLVPSSYQISLSIDSQQDWGHTGFVVFGLLRRVEGQEGSGTEHAKFSMDIRLFVT